MMPGGIVAHRRRRPRPGARPRARAVALDWGIFSQHIRGEFTQQLHRWVVERSFAWLIKNRRLVRDFEQRTDLAETLIRIAATVTMLKRIA